MWNGFFERASANAKFLMICHSQGAIHVRNALLAYPKELRERILVVAIAPAAYIYRETCAQVLHYRVSRKRDPVPYIDREGAQRAKETIIDLNPHPDAYWHDHNFNSPTYFRELLKRIDNFVTSQGTTI